MSVWRTEMRKCKNLNKSSEPKGTINYINKGNMGILIGEKREKKGELRKFFFNAWNYPQFDEQWSYKSKNLNKIQVA